jgi:ankyrin repeat protein
LIFNLIRDNLGSVTRKSKRRIFGSIPDSVETAYTAILNKSTDKEQARKLLAIICVATRPLTINEISLALTMEPDDKTYEDLEKHSEDWSKAWIRNLCGLFISVIDGRVYLLHQTAKEFLMAENYDIRLTSDRPSDQIWKHSLTSKESNFLLAQICIWYLRLADVDAEPLFITVHVQTERRVREKRIAKLVSNHAFFEYSSTNWAAHFRAAKVQQGNILVDLALELCDTKFGRYMTWFPVYWDQVSTSTVPAGLTTLHLASHFELKAVISQLLLTHIDVNARDNDGRTPLWAAVVSRKETIVRQLLEAPGIDVNARDTGGQTPLLRAVDCRDDAIVRLLLAAPEIEVNAQDTEGRTPLWVAVDNMHERIVGQLLLAPRVDVNAQENKGQTPLWWAARNGYEEVVRLLLAAPEIAVNTRDRKGRTPLLIAANSGHEEVIGLLLRAPRIDVNARDEEDKITPLCIAIARKHEAAACKLLEEPRIDVNAPDGDGRTPLWWAAYHGYQEIVHRLLAAPGIEVNTRNNAGCTPLWRAVTRGHKAVVCQLLAAPGIDINVRDTKYGTTALWQAASRGYEAITYRLLATPGIDVNARDVDGETPLWRAATRGHKTIFSQLLAVPGIDVNARNKKGEISIR